MPPEDGVSPATRTRVLIAEDEGTLREALARLIGGEPSLELVGAAKDAVQAVDLAETHRPDVALLDVKMPGGGGPRAARDIKDRSPQTRVIALSAYDDRASVLEMLRAGASGYLVKGTSPGEILNAIRGAASGKAALSVDVAAAVVHELAGQLKQKQLEEDERRSRLERVRRLLTEGSFLMVFQPIANLRNSSVIGLEALARFDGDPARGPEAWLAEAESLGLRLDLELAAVRTALGYLELLPTNAFLAVNLSPSTAVEARFLESLDGLATERIVIEVTEHARVQDYDALNAALKVLRARGVRLAIDDAGAGFASLQHIVRLAPDFIKLDITLTRGIDADPVRRALATALITFASEIDATIIAEGIETKEEFDTLRGLGVSCGQGYYLAVPGPLEPAD